MNQPPHPMRRKDDYRRQERKFQIIVAIICLSIILGVLAFGILTTNRRAADTKLLLDELRKECVVTTVVGDD